MSSMAEHKQQLIDRVVALEEIASNVNSADTAHDVLSEAEVLRAIIEERYGEPVPAHPFTSEDRRQAAALAEHGAAMTVYEYTCETIRQRRHAGETSSEIADALGISKGAVSHHAQGDCDHGHDVLATGRSGSRITAKKCAEIRRRRSNGDRITDIIDDYDVPLTKWVVSDHASGACPHEIDEPPVATNKVPSEECGDWRGAVRRGETVYGLAADSRFCRMTIQNHVSGDCDHDLDVHPLQYNGDEWVTAPEEPA